MLLVLKHTMQDNIFFTNKYWDCFVQKQMYSVKERESIVNTLKSWFWWGMGLEQFRMNQISHAFAGTKCIREKYLKYHFATITLLYCCIIVVLYSSSYSLFFQCFQTKIMMFVSSRTLRVFQFKNVFRADQWEIFAIYSVRHMYVCFLS